MFGTSVLFQNISLREFTPHKRNINFSPQSNLIVVELNHTDLATDDDKAHNIDTWAKLFKATTWEEIKMITKENPSMNSAAESIYLSNSDFEIRERCRAREDAIAHENYQKEQIEKLTNENSELTNENAKLSEKNASLSGEVDYLSSENASLSNENARLKKLLEENGIKS